MAINFDAHATLYRWEEVEKQNPNDSDQFGSVQIWDGTLEGCIKQFLAKSDRAHVAYDIMVGDDAGIGRPIRQAHEIENLALIHGFG